MSPKSENKSSLDISPDNLQDRDNLDELTYQCPYCHKSFKSQISLRMHMMRSHRVSPHGEGEPPSIEIEAPSIERDLKKEARLAKTALELARFEQRLRETNPRLHQQLFGASRDETVSRELAYIELAKLIREMRKAEEIQAQTISKSDNNTQLIQSYESRISELQKEIATLKNELNRKELQALQEKIKELKDELREVREQAVRGQSDLTAIVSTLSKHLENATDRLETAIMAYLGFVPLDIIEKFSFPPKQVESGAYEGLLSKVSPKWVSEQ